VRSSRAASWGEGVEKDGDGGKGQTWTVRGDIIHQMGAAQAGVK